MGHKTHLRTRGFMFICNPCQTGAAHNPASGMRCISLKCKCGCLVRGILTKPAAEIIAPLKEPVTVEKIERILRKEIVE